MGKTIAEFPAPTWCSNCKMDRAMYITVSKHQPYDALIHLCGFVLSKPGFQRTAPLKLFRYLPFLIVVYILIFSASRLPLKLDLEYIETLTLK